MDHFLIHYPIAEKVLILWANSINFLNHLLYPAHDCQIHCLECVVCHGFEKLLLIGVRCMILMMSLYLGQSVLDPSQAPSYLVQYFKIEHFVALSWSHFQLHDLGLQLH